jgi:hypothetical protein
MKAIRDVSLTIRPGKELIEKLVEEYINTFLD